MTNASDIDESQRPGFPVERLVGPLGPLETLAAFVDWEAKHNPQPRKTKHVAQWALEEIERLRAGFERYETARRMNPRQWADAWELNVSTGKPFDEIIDHLKPFLRPNAQVKRRA